MDIKKSIVAILNRQKKIIGTGFVVGKDSILTCAHVIEQATGGLNDQVIVRFSVSNLETIAQVDMQSFSYSYEQDIALLKTDFIPNDIYPLPLGSAIDSPNHDFYAYGYAVVTKIQGIGARGKIIDVVDNNSLVQLTSQEPDHGMSDAPVFDVTKQLVVGMIRKGKGVIEKDQNIRNTQTTFATSMDAIIAICSELNLQPSKYFEPDPPKTTANGQKLSATIPGLPVHYLIRDFEMQRLRSLILNNLDFNKIVVLRGMGGTGKTVLVSAFVHEDTTLSFFPDGIIWLTLGRSPILRQLFEQIGNFFGDSSANYSDEIIAKQNLSKVINSKKCLIILDDVWDASFILVFRNLFFDNNCKIIVTTRDSRIATLLDAEEYKLEMLTEKQSIDLLINWTGTYDKDYATIAKNLGYLPLAIKLAGARLAFGLSVAEWLQRFNNISTIKTDRKSRDRDDSLETSIELSVDAIFGENDHPDEKLLYYTFGIFQDDSAIPQHVVIRLWLHINANLNEFKCEEIINDLISLALIERNIIDHTLSLHDLLHSYNKEKLGTRGVQTHSELLMSYNIKHIPWYLIPNDDYLYFNLAYHMQNAQKDAELFQILLTAPDWIDKYAFERLRDFEFLVLSIWDLYNKKKKEDSENFIKKWLNKHQTSNINRHSNSKILAVRCAYKSENIHLLASCLYHSELID